MNQLTTTIQGMLENMARRVPMCHRYHQRGRNKTCCLCGETMRLTPDEVKQVRRAGRISK